MTEDRPSGERLDRLDRALFGTIVAASITTLMILTVPGFHGHITAPALDLVLDTVAFVVSGVASALTWVRFGERRDELALFQAAAFLALAIADGIALFVSMSQDFGLALAPGAIAEGQMFVWLAARLLAAGLLVVGGARSLRRSKVRRPAFLFGATLAVMLVVVGAVVAIGHDLTSLISYPVPDERPLEPMDIYLTTLGVALHLVGTGLFLLAVLTCRALWRRDAGVGDAYLAVALVFAAFAQLDGAIFPSAHPEQVGAADLLRLVFYITLVRGIQAEAGSVMNSLRSANSSLERLREAELERSILEERERLSRELHDGLAQDLWLAKLKLSRLAALPDLGLAAAALCVELGTAIESGLANARHAVLALHPARDGSDSSIAELVGRTVDDFADRFGVRTEFERGDSLPRLTHRAQAEMLRIVQEALTNVGRHADATLVRVVVGSDSRGLTISIADNGRGFDRAAVGPGSFGLSGMEERAALIHATLTIDARTGDGTRVNLTVPAAVGASLPGTG